MNDMFTIPPPGGVLGDETSLEDEINGVRFRLPPAGAVEGSEHNPIVLPERIKAVTFRTMVVWLLRR